MMCIFLGIYCIWVRSCYCGCLVTWFCYQLIAKPGNKTATVLPFRDLTHMVWGPIDNVLWLSKVAWCWLGTYLFFVNRIWFHNFNSSLVTLLLKVGSGWVIHPIENHACDWLSWPKSKLTHWGWVTHICVSKLTIIGSDNGLSPDWCQAIWTNAGIMLDP